METRTKDEARFARLFKKEVEVTPDYIYALYYELDGKRDYFYVGRSIDIDRRMGEHLREAKAGHTEDSREFIRNLLAVGIMFDHEILAVVTTEDEHYEDFYCWQMMGRGYKLTNMKQGDAEKRAEEAIRGNKYSGPKEFLEARAAELEKEKIKIAKVKRDTDLERTLYSFEDPQKKWVSPWMANRLKK